MSQLRVWYRPGLDGVRGLAVAAVVLYHARVPGTSGGFLGVDVFFVLSGFLITSLLLQEFVDTGRIDLAAFWGRRARRLLPAVFAMVFAVAAYAAWAAPDVSRLRLPGDVAATLVYVANWRFIVADLGYFDQYGDPSPVLHTWSLAVEEQFYLIWPLIVLAALAWGRHRLDREARPARLWLAGVTALVGGIAASAALTWWLSGSAADLTRAYYGTDTRAQELLAGALLATLMRRQGWWQERPGDAPPRWWPDVVAGVALAGLLALVVLVQDPLHWLHAGGQVLVSLLAMGLVLAAAHPAAGRVQRALSWRPLTALGIVSYGLYVWHWPVFVLLDPDRTGLHGAALAALRLAVAVAVAAASYRLIEEPVRTGRFWTGAVADSRRGSGSGRGDAGAGGRREAPALVALATGLACLAAVMIATAGAGMSQAATAAAGPPPLLPPADTSGPAAPLRVFVLGDSTAFGLFSQFPPAASLNLQADGSTLLGCDLIGGRVVDDKVETGVPASCADWPRVWRERVGLVHPDVALFLPGNGMLFDHEVDGTRYRFGTPAYENLLRSYLDGVLTGLRAGTTRLAIATMPCFGKPDTGTDGSSAAINDPKRQTWVDGVLTRYLADHRGAAELIDLRGYLCPADTYSESLHGVRLRQDGVHWTREGADLVWTWLAPRLAATPRATASRATTSRATTSRATASRGTA